MSLVLYIVKKNMVSGAKSAFKRWRSKMKKRHTFGGNMNSKKNIIKMENKAKVTWPHLYKTKSSQTQASRLHTTVKQDGTGTSRSFAFYGGKSRKIKNKSIRLQKAKQIFELSSQFTTDTTSSGLQAVTDAGPMFDAITINLMHNYNKSVIKQPSSAAVGVLPDIEANQKSFKLYLESVQQYLTFSNCTTGNITVDIYDVICKRDRSSPVTPETDWYNGVVYDQNPSGISQDNKTPWQTPFYSNLFNDYWKVKKITHVELAQGRSHEHILKFSPNRIFDTEISAANAQFAGLTMYCILVVRGMPAVVSTATSTATLAEAKIACVSRRSYRFRYIDDIPSTYYRTGLAFNTNPVSIVSEGAGTAGAIVET
nr:MAG: capsid protein [Cressdnaviricota sp.]